MVIEPNREILPLGMAPPRPRIRYQFPKRMRLLVASDFERVFAARSSAGDGMIVLYGAPSGLEYPRLGLVVSRKLGNSVARSRWKRALREAFRLTQHALPPLDLVCLPRPAAQRDTHRLCESFPVLATRIARRFERDKQG
jgi:ribonuclease P protein component